MLDEEGWLARYDYLIGATLSRLANAARSPQEHSDLEQEGRIGLLKAIRRFDPTRHKQFSSYAIPWIRGSMEEYLRSPAASWVKRAGQDAVRRLDQALANLPEGSTEEELAGELGLSPEGLEAFLARQPSAALVALEGQGEEGEAHELSAEDPAPPVEELAATAAELDRLPWLQRRAMQALVIEGWTVPQTAGVLRIPVSALRRHVLPKAKRRLADSLGNPFDDRTLAQNTGSFFFGKPFSGRRNVPMGGRRFSVRIEYRDTPEGYEALARAAQERGVSMQQLLRQLARQATKAKPRQGPKDGGR